MSLFGKLFRRNKSAEEKFRNELEEDNSVKEVFEDEEEETAEDEMYGEEQGEDGQESDKPEDDPDMEYEIVEREILPAKIICPDCGGITLEGLDLCDKCGGELH
jgi:hypothetical protein